MKWNLKTMLPAAATSLVALTSLVNAADDAHIRNLENRVSALEQRKGANGMINPPARPFLANAAGMFLTGEFIYWQAHESGLGYAIANQGPNPESIVSHGKIKNLDFKWNPGFRVGLGWDLPHDGWDLYLTWTRLHSRASGSVNVDSRIPGSTVFTIWDNPSAFPIVLEATTVSSKWRNWMNVLDLELGREFFVSKWLTLRPFMGLRSAWLSQKFKVDAVNSTISFTELERMKNKFWGLGIRGGLNTQWGFGGGWSIYGDAAVSLLYGNFRVRERSTLFTPTIVSQNNLHVSNFYHQAAAATDLALGLRYDVMFDDDNYHLGIQAGYEQHIYFSQNQLINFVNSGNNGKFVSNQGDLTYNGISVGLRFDF